MLSFVSVAIRYQFFYESNPKRGNKTNKQKKIKLKEKETREKKNFFLSFFLSFFFFKRKGSFISFENIEKEKVSDQALTVENGLLAQHTTNGT